MAKLRNNLAAKIAILVAVLAFSVGLTVAALAESSRAAGPTVTNVTADPRDPWSDRVDITYDITGDTANLYIAITVEDGSGNQWEAKTFDGDAPSAEPGTHQVIWIASADAPDVVASDAVVTVALMLPDVQPTATADTAGMNESDLSLSVTDASQGVLGNDDFGINAPGTVVGVVKSSSSEPSTTGVGQKVQGEYGILTLASDGTYTYELTADLKNGDVRTDVFTYTIQDNDGDQATATLTISITGEGPSITGSVPQTLITSDADLTRDVSISVSNLFSSIYGGADGQWSLTASFVSSPIAGVKALVDGAWEEVITTISDLGSTVTGTTSSGKTAFVVRIENGSVVFDQQLPLKHPDGEGTKDMTLDELTLQVTVTDSIGETATAEGTVILKVSDSVPTITDGNLTLTPGAMSEEQTMAVDYGADRPASTTATVDGIPIADEVHTAISTGHAIVTVKKTDAGFSYYVEVLVSYLSETVTEELTFVVTDADGDTATATLTVTIEASPHIPSVSNATIIVDEALLPGGVAAHADGHAASGTGSFTVSLDGDETGTVEMSGEGYVTITLHDGEAASITDGTVTASGVAVQVTGVQQSGDNYTISYSYELGEAQKHSNTNAIGKNDALSDTIEILVTNESGNTATGALTVEVHDDGPSISADGDITVMIASVSADRDLTLYYGADGVSGSTLTLNGQPVPDEGGVFTVGTGVFTLTKTSTGYVYRFEALDATGTSIFRFGITDADGDVAVRTARVTVTGSRDSTRSISVMDNAPAVDGADVPNDDDAGTVDSVVDETATPAAEGAEGEQEVSE